MASRDARQIEATLAERILEFHGDDPSLPGSLGAEWDALDRFKPCGVWMGNVLYLVVHDSTEALNDDGGDHRQAIIVARVEAGRIIDLGEAGTTL